MSVEKIYILLPGRGQWEITPSFLENVSHLRQLEWTFKKYQATPALIEKSNGSSRPYVGQQYESNYFDLVQDGWTHDHCEICSIPLCESPDAGKIEGYNTNNVWLCKICYEHFIEPVDLNESINSLKIIDQ
jgi:hypothetical protein